ncbi:MAG: tRNA pseudouridine(38-40) synthase TruA [Chloroflexi bacterium]|nr:tRNA pseudouridine(38-40) synthase TruA [Chloroflexota bacterium]
MTRRIALILEYEGTAYAGSQRQGALPTVQAEVERAAEALTGAGCRLAVAGRTDAGTHAAGQVAAFDTESDLAPQRIRDGLNHHLPEDIAVVEAHEVARSFDPRRHAASRVYRYTFSERAARSPLRRRFVHPVGRTLDVEAMSQALAYLEGTRDFAPFSGALPAGKSTMRRMLRAQAWREGGEVYLELEANAFLPQQVRRTAAAVLRVGLGKMTVTAFEALADSPVRGAAEHVLPAGALCLQRVAYPDFPPRRAAQNEIMTQNEMVVGRYAAL